MLPVYFRLARRLPAYLRGRDTVEEGRRLLAEGFAHRERNFLLTAERCVFGFAHSPYRPLLDRAGCEFGDLRRLVEADGLEAALRSLRAEGVYISFEESKGREPVRRGNLEFEVKSSDFTNPFASIHMHSSTSGSTGTRTRNPIDLDFSAAHSPIRMAIAEAQGILDLPVATVRGGLPESSGFGGSLKSVRWNRPIDRWFTPQLEPPRKPELRFRLAHHYIMTVARLCGTPFTPPEPIRMHEVGRIADWAAETVAREPHRCLIDCTPSMALRIAVHAKDAGIDLTGVTFRGAGEPMTEGKMRGIRAAGADAIVDYAMSGNGGTGSGCTKPIGVNEQHLHTYHLAIIQSEREVSGNLVEPLLFTTLNPNHPRVSLNMESDDYGTIFERDCGCPLHDLGFRTHIRDVRSFKKLTTEGVTLVGSEMEHVLESVLPERFGGSALDYQLVEEEDEQGFTRISIHVSPGIDLADENELIQTVLSGLEKGSISADLAGRLWNQAGAMQVRRVQPILGGRGKLMPLRRADGTPAAGTM